MRRRDVLVLFVGAAFAFPLLAVAREPAGVPRIAILMGGTPVVEAPRLAAFWEAFERLGYIDGRTVHIELHYVEGRGDRFEPMAREIVSRQPSVIVCIGRQETIALQAATRTIPIVFIQVTDPVEMGLVASLARPGGNTTGFTQMTGELDPKRLELLHAIAPSVSRAAFVINPRRTPGLEKRFADAEAAAKVFGITLRLLDATTPAELTKALGTIETLAGEALLVINDPLFAVERSRIIDFATAHHVPTVFEQRQPVVQGGLLGYGPDLIENARLAAGYVDKLLKGATPADLPVQQPTKFELVINLKTAKAQGLTVPQSLLARADEVIE
jgi:putative ABC transport system substrate-binding protein